MFQHDSAAVQSNACVQLCAHLFLLSELEKDTYLMRLNKHQSNRKIGRAARAEEDAVEAAADEL